MKEIRPAKMMNGRITLNLGDNNLPRSSNALYRTLQEEIMMNALKTFREHYSEKPVIFWGRLACRVQEPGETLTDFPGYLEKLALKAYPTGSQNNRDHLVLRRFLE